MSVHFRSTCFPCMQREWDDFVLNSQGFMQCCLGFSGCHDVLRLSPALPTSPAPGRSSSWCCCILLQTAGMLAEGHCKDLGQICCYLSRLC